MAALPALRRNLDDFWAAAEPVPASMLRSTSAQQFDFLQTAIVPKREEIYSQLLNLAAAGQARLQQQETQFAETRKEAAGRLSGMLALGVLPSFVVALLSVRHAENLERAAERHYAEVEQTKRELQQLSARLLEVEEDGRKNLMPLRFLLADDHTLMRQGLRHILESNSDFDVVVEASSGIEAVEAAREHKSDVAVVDVAMKELNGIETTAQILKHSPHTAVLILSMYSDERYVLRAVKAGARGYVLKNSAGDELIRAIYAVQKGTAYFSPAVARIFQDGFARLKDASEVNDRFELLTNRERQIYQLLAEGNSNKEIATRLNLSLHTVETHRWRIMEKMDLHSTAELVSSAVRRGMVT
jgi:two-component system, NarL family, response regulator NreC